MGRTSRLFSLDSAGGSSWQYGGYQEEDASYEGQTDELIKYCNYNVHPRITLLQFYIVNDHTPNKAKLRTLYQCPIPQTRPS